MLVGTGQGEASLRALAAELGIAERFIFAGFHPDPTPFYMTADLFALSSNYEGFGNVIVEAMACGTRPCGAKAARSRVSTHHRGAAIS